MSEPGWEACSHIGKVKSRNEDAYLALPEQGLFAVLDGLSSTSGGGVAARLALEALPELLAQLPIQQALAEVSRRIWAQGLRSRAMYLMGAAVVVARVTGTRVELCHAGDCRAYLHDGQLHQLTADHVTEVRGRQQLVLHLGLQNLEPELQHLELAAGARLLLCSDGVHRELSQDVLARLLLEDQPAEKLIEAALEAGGRDNLTALVLSRP